MFRNPGIVDKLILDNPDFIAVWSQLSAAEPTSEDYQAVAEFLQQQNVITNAESLSSWIDEMEELYSEPPRHLYVLQNRQKSREMSILESFLFMFFTVYLVILPLGLLFS